MNNDSLSRKTALIGLICALAIIAHYLEGLLPPLIVGTHVKLGVANVFTLYVLARFSPREAFSVTLVRCLLGGLLAGAPVSILYSLTGGMLSTLVMSTLLPLYKKSKCSLISLSVAGAFSFNIGQLVVGAFLNGKAMLLYFPIMSVLSVPTGIFVGALATFALAFINKNQ